jgi:hypothetical protein
MKHATLVTKSLMGLAMLAFLVGVWVAPALAAAPDNQEHRGLEYRLKWALLRVDVLQDHLDNAGEAAVLLQELIADEQADGHDTSILDEALDAFQSSRGTAQDLRDTAAQILNDKVGFDDEGKVVDPQAARETLKSARETMNEARKTMREARQDLREAMREYRQTRRGDSK